MSKQYLTLHTLDSISPTDIFSLAPTPTSILSGSGGSKILIHSTTDPSFPLKQSLSGAHKLGVHHIAASKDGNVAVSVGFGGECKVWGFKKSDENASVGTGEWVPRGSISVGLDEKKSGGVGVGEIWAVALSAEGRYAATSAHDGKVRVWELGGGASGEEVNCVREYETKGSFGMSVDISADGRLVAVGCENGSVYVFNNDSGRMVHSLPGLVKAVRAVAFSPATKLLAAAGDARIIALYDVPSGEQVSNLAGHGAWIMSLDWSATGEYLLSGSFDGKAKIWAIETHNCVATHGESDKALWSVKWLPKMGRTEMFAVAGASRSISFYREASGG